MAEPISGKGLWTDMTLSDVRIEFEDKTNQDAHSLVLRSRLPLLVRGISDRWVHGKSYKMDTFSSHVMREVSTCIPCVKFYNILQRLRPISKNVAAGDCTIAVSFKPVNICTTSCSIFVSH